MKKLLSIICLLLITGLTTAQHLYIGGQAAYTKSQDATEGAIMPAGAVRIDLSGLKLEGSIGYKAEEYSGGYGSAKIKATSYPFLATAFISVLPFAHLEGGIGWYNTKIEYSGFPASIPSETVSSIGYHAGAGIEIPLGSLLLTGDIRYVIEKTKLANTQNVSELKSDFYMIVVGLMFKVL